METIVYHDCVSIVSLSLPQRLLWRFLPPLANCGLGYSLIHFVKNLGSFTEHGGILFDCFVSRVFMVLWYPQLWAGRFRGLKPGRGKIFFCSPQRPNRLWGPHNHFFGGYLSSFLGVKRQGLEVDHLHQVPRLIMSGAVALHLMCAFVCEQG